MRSIPSLLLGLALLSAASLPAQTFRLERTSDGTLGRALSFRISGAPAGSFAIYLVSTNAGPTPLTVFGDPRSLKVGLDLAPLWQGKPVPATGTTTFALGPLPNQSSLHGAVLHNQAVTIPGPGTRFIGSISNNTLAQLGQPGRPANAPAAMRSPRSIAFASIDPRIDASRSSVVLPGGLRGDPRKGGALATSEIFDYDTLSFRAGPALRVARVLPVVVPLRDGRVLICGGLDSRLNPLSSCEVYDARTGRSTFTGSMNKKRAGHAGVLLADGRVLVYGGTESSNGLDILTRSLKSTEIWDPRTGRWTMGPNGRDYLLLPELTLLANGRVLMSGGFRVTKFIIGIPQGTTNRCQEWTGSSWQTVGGMRDGRIDLPGSAVRLNDGRVLRAGGVNVSSSFAVSVLSRAEVYNPSTRSWSAVGGIGSPRAAASFTKMGNGTVIMAGGATGTLSNIVPSPRVQRFDPRTNTWRSLANLNRARFGHVAVRLKDDLLVLFGGNTTINTTSNSVETIRD